MRNFQTVLSPLNDFFAMEALVSTRFDAFVRFTFSQPFIRSGKVLLICECHYYENVRDFFNFGVLCVSIGTQTCT